jgi:dTDP-4-amino-4,6-dideoxygalactose transaminase
MPNINAALGLAQLEQLPEFLLNKRKTFEKYKEFFSDTSCQLFSEPDYAQSNYWLNAILLNDNNEKDDFLRYTYDNNIMTRPVWQLMNLLPMFNQCQKDKLINATELVKRLVNLPSSVI